MKPTIEQRLLSNARLDVCKECPSKIEETTNTVDGHEIFFWRCAECGCPIVQKSHNTKKGLCPIGKWNDIENTML